MYECHIGRGQRRTCSFVHLQQKTGWFHKRNHESSGAMEEPIAPETSGWGQRRFPSDWVSGGNLERDRLPGAFQLCSLNRAEMAGGVPASRLERS